MESRLLEVLLRANDLISQVDTLEQEQIANQIMKERLERSIVQMEESNKVNREALDIATHALEILNKVSDESVRSAYKFLEQQLNAALAQMFQESTRKIVLRESMLRNQYPQLEIQLIVEGDKTRSLKSDSGHGLAQIVSWLSILSLIVITNSRRLMVMDEILSGLSVHNRKIVTDIMWQFTTIGFQFIVNEHGYIPRNSKVYHLEMVGGVSEQREVYIEESGVYLQGKLGTLEYSDITDGSEGVHGIYLSEMPSNQPVVEPSNQVEPSNPYDTDNTPKSVNTQNTQMELPPQTSFISNESNNVLGGEILDI